MNEEQKNIETCLAEDVLSEVANVPTDPQFRSLVDEALDPLKQQAAAQEGYDGYEKVVWTHKPYTFTSQVKQMKSNLILLIRRLWRFPFGRGTTAASDAGSSAAAATPIRSLADMWQHYITRLKGNPEYGIPSRLSSLTDLPDAPALLADRKISGVPEAEDGMSLVRIACGEYESVTELQDDTTGWTLYGSSERNSNNKVTPLLSMYPALKKLTLGCTSAIGNHSILSTTLEDFNLRDIETWKGNFHVTLPNGMIKAPKLKTINLAKNYDYGQSFPYGKGIYFPMITKIYGYNRLWQSRNLSALRMIVLGSLDNFGVGSWDWVQGDASNLMHMEYGADGGAGLQVSQNLSWWTATNCIDASRTDLIEEGSTATNNLQQFIQNFKTYIAERLTDQGSGLTLTLSQEVRDAIQQDPEIVSIITGKGWTISPAPSV